MKEGRLIVTGEDADGSRIRIDVMDLDDRSFRAFVLDSFDGHGWIQEKDVEGVEIPFRAKRRKQRKKKKGAVPTKTGESDE